MPKAMNQVAVVFLPEGKERVDFWPDSLVSVQVLIMALGK